MAIFLHFPNYHGAIVNANYIVNLRVDSRVAVQADIGQLGISAKEGDIIFCIYITLATAETWQLNFSSKEKQQEHYNEILLAIKPAIIGSNGSLPLDE